MKKIAILTPTFNYYSGVDRVAQERAEYYSKKGNDVTIFALEAQIKSKKYKVEKIGMPRNSFLQRVYRLFFPLFLKDTYIKNLKEFDEIISLNYPMDLFAVKAKNKFNKRYTAWVSGIAPGENITEKLYMSIFRYFYIKCLRYADEIICVSNYVKNRLIEKSGIGPERFKVVYNEIDKNRFNKDIHKEYKSKINQIIEQYKLKDKITFLYVGRLATSKRIHLLIKAFNRVKIDCQNSKLIIVGKPTFKRYFKKLVRMADEDVIFTGFVKDEDLPAYYAVCDAFVTASHDEGFNLPAAEAQACDKPVIAFDIGSHPEIVKKGELIPEGDYEGLVNAMAKFCYYSKEHK